MNRRTSWMSIPRNIGNPAPAKLYFINTGIGVYLMGNIIEQLEIVLKQLLQNNTKFVQMLSGMCEYVRYQRMLGRITPRSWDLRPSCDVARETTPKESMLKEPRETWI